MATLTSIKPHSSLSRWRPPLIPPFSNGANNQIRSPASSSNILPAENTRGIGVPCLLQIVPLLLQPGYDDRVLASDGQKSHSSSEMEVVELRRLNMELQLQKRNLSGRISTLESHIASLAKSDVLEKIKAEASLLRHTNEDLCKQVEGLQMSQMNEVEELAYLRWVNSCLRDELRGCSKTCSDKPESPDSVDQRRESICFTPFNTDEDYSNTTKRLHLIKKIKKWPITDEDLQQMKYSDNPNWDDLLQGSARRHSISGTNYCPEDMVLNKKRQSDSFMCSKELDKRAEVVVVSHKYDSEVCKVVKASLDVEKRALRIPNPPPRWWGLVENSWGDVQKYPKVLPFYSSLDQE